MPRGRRPSQALCPESKRLSWRLAPRPPGCPAPHELGVCGPPQLVGPKNLRPHAIFPGPPPQALPEPPPPRPSRRTLGRNPRSAGGSWGGDPREGRGRGRSGEGPGRRAGKDRMRVQVFLGETWRTPALLKNFPMQRSRRTFSALLKRNSVLVKRPFPPLKSTLCMNSHRGALH